MKKVNTPHMASHQPTNSGGTLVAKNCTNRAKVHQNAP